MKCDIDGLVQDCSNSNANALELLQSCTKPSICSCKVLANGLFRNIGLCDDFISCYQDSLLPILTHGKK